MTEYIAGFEAVVKYEDKEQFKRIVEKYKFIAKQKNQLPCRWTTTPPITFTVLSTVNNDSKALMCELIMEGLIKELKC